MDAYVDRVCAEIQGMRESVARFSPPRALSAIELPERVDSIYLGGGTPSLLSAEQVRQLFTALRGEFGLPANAEMTLECAPGQISDETSTAMLGAGVNRVSFGVQSFIDREAAAVGRLHTRAMCLEEIARMRASGVENINVDLICGLPGQTRESWRESVKVAIETGVPHVSLYMLEVDEDSRLGREVLAHGARYGAGDVPGDDEIAEWYAEACERLEAAGIAQYEISNFAHSGCESRHNMRYWGRGPYLGFGLDAHSMLRRGVGGVRWANGDDLERYLGTRDWGLGAGKEGLGTGDSGLKGTLNVLSSESARPGVEWVDHEQAFEEAMFLGLRMNEGVDLAMLRAEFGNELAASAADAVVDIQRAGLIVRDGEHLRLTARGRTISNEVFSRLLVGTPA